MSEMNPEDRKRFDTMQSDIKEIKDAFLGNKLLGDNGFKGQLDEMRIEIKLLKEEVQTLRDERIENKVYILIIKGLFGMLAASTVALIFKKF